MPSRAEPWYVDTPRYHPSARRDGGAGVLARELGDRFLFNVLTAVVSNACTGGGVSQHTCRTSALRYLPAFEF